MADIKFDVEFVPRDAGSMAQRAAVLLPLSRGDTVRRLDEVPARFERVLRLWRRRCVELKEAGWGPAQGLKFQYMRNCLPSGVKTVARRAVVRWCRQPAVCPWCWCREVVKKTWDRVTAGLAAVGSMGGRGATGPFPYKLAVAATTVRVPDAAGQPHAALDAMKLSLDRAARAWAGRAAGTLLLGTVAPGTAGWVSRLRLLLVLPAGAAAPTAARVVANPTRRAVAAAVARFARYPAGMMAGDAGLAAALLAARRGYKLYRAAGVLRDPGRLPPGHRPAGRDPGRVVDV